MYCHIKKSSNFFIRKRRNKLKDKCIWTCKQWVALHEHALVYQLIERESKEEFENLQNCWPVDMMLPQHIINNKNAFLWITSISYLLLSNLLKGVAYYHCVERSWMPHVPVVVYVVSREDFILRTSKFC